MSAVRATRAVIARAQAADVPFLAAAIAYYALVSVVPAVLLAVAAATALGGGTIADRVGRSAGEVLTPVAIEILEEALTSGSGRAGASVISVGVLIWGAIKVFRGLDIAFSRVYGTRASMDFVDQLRNAGVVIVTIGAGFGGMIVLGAAFAALPLPPIGRVLGLVALLVALFLVFLPVYYVFPGTRITVAAAVPGAVLAAVGWVTLQAAFQLYASVARTFELYGVLGGVLLLVTWFYLAAMLLLLGAVVNYVLGTPDRQAEESAHRTAEPTMAVPDDGASLEEQVTALREAVEALEARLEEHTVPRSEVEDDLERYVRSRVGRGHARGWGPYLVLLYGTAMTLAAFYLLSGGWAILAMVVIWLSTLGLYVVMVLAGAAIGVVDLPGRAFDAVRDRRS